MARELLPSATHEFRAATLYLNTVAPVPYSSKPDGYCLFISVVLEVVMTSAHAGQAQNRDFWWEESGKKPGGRAHTRRRITTRKMDGRFALTLCFDRLRYPF